MLSDEGLSREAILDAMIDADNAVLAPARAAGITTALHMCRGNNRSSWIAAGDSYESTAEQAFSRLEVDRLLLEYDTERAGGFAPLRFVPDSTTVVLGLISSKFPELESRDGLLARIEQATEFVPIERLGAQPAVRVRLDGARQPDHLGRPAAQARARRVGRRRGLGIVTATSGILGR